MDELLKKLNINETTDKLTDDQQDAIGRSVLAELDGKKEEAAPEEQAEESVEQAEVKPEVEEKKEEKKEEVKVEPKVELKKEEAKPETKAEEKVEAPDKALEDYAVKNGLTIDEAKEELDKIDSISVKYKNDPKEMAKALRSVQSAYDKLRVEREEKKAPEPAPNYQNVEAYVISEINKNKDDIISKYRESFPAITADRDDDYVFELVKKDAMTQVEMKAKEIQLETVSKAKEKRTQLILNLQEQDKRFLPDVKAVLERTSDRQVMSEKFDLQDIIYWAKGKQLDKLVKEAEERGYKRGKEEPVIMGEKNNAQQPKATPKATKTVALTPEQKERALNMFEGVSMTEQEKYDAYMEIYKDELQPTKK